MRSFLPGTTPKGPQRLKRWRRAASAVTRASSSFLRSGSRQGAERSSPGPGARHTNGDPRPQGPALGSPCFLRHL
eukprot:985473-Alexandrium_andersonii.AAC.1